MSEFNLVEVHEVQAIYWRALICDKGHASCCSTMHSPLINLKHRLHGEDKRKLWLFTKWILQNVSFDQIIPRYLQMCLHEASLASLVLLPQYHRLVWLTSYELPDGCSIVYTHFCNPLHSGWYIVWVLGKKQYIVIILS